MAKDNIELTKMFVFSNSHFIYFFSGLIVEVLSLSYTYVILIRFLNRYFLNSSDF